MPRRYKDEGLMTLVGEYTSVYLPCNRDASPETVRAYRISIDLFDEYLAETGGADADKRVIGRGLRACGAECLSSRNVLGYLDWLRDVRGNGVSTRELRLSAITGLLDYAVTLDLSYAAQLVAVSKIKVGGGGQRKIVGHMTEGAWASVVSQPNVTCKRTEHRNWVFMVLMYEVAGRNSEIIGLRAKDLILDHAEGPKAYIRGKGRRERLVPLRASCADIVAEYVERFHPGRARSADPLFYVKRGGEKYPLSPDCVEAFLKRYGAAARAVNPAVPERVHPHLVRHTRAVHLLEGGMPVEELSKFLGHADIATTRVYIQSSAEAKRVSLSKVKGKDPERLARPGFWNDDEDVLRQLENLE